MTPAPARKGRNGLPPVTACKYGHPYVPENTYVKRDGTRSCQTCRREQRAARNVGIREQGYEDDWAIDLLAAVVNQAKDDYIRGVECETAAAYLRSWGLLTPEGKIRRRRERTTP